MLSYVQTRALVAARNRGEPTLASSLDLGLTSVVLSLSETGVEVPGQGELAWAEVEDVSEHENVCFEVLAGELHPIRGYSEEFSRTYQLMPTAAEPAMLISGFVMHRIRDVSPAAGARAMVRAVLPLRGRVLDTATGLGYAAIEAAAHASEVVTVELDPWAQQMAAKNPWSRALFENPKISQLIGNSKDVIQGFASESFTAIVHDPPAINLAGELYSEEFYAQAYRVLARSGRVFHYVGDPHSASGGRVTKGVVRRLQSVGFKKVVLKPDAFGVLAFK
jgi:uncharacterized protein